ncbi:hypothetical protein ACIP5Y_21200 [Nocardia sp. NPDC088792]|uniref:hypothetical protein n=1 Tax=Nocardia sp. NPDC088792 TaxID=3364332 RepID=UPI00381E2D3B
MPDHAFTKTERALLVNVRDAVGPCIASPEYAVEGFRRGERSGGGHGFHYQFTKTAIVGTWHEFIEAAWYPDGRPHTWRQGQLLAEAKVTYARLRRWRDSLPTEVREQALTWSRIYPVDTRDSPALEALVLRLLADPEPVVDPEPVDLLDLLEMTNA